MRIVEDRLGRARLDDAAFVHEHDLIGDLRAKPISWVTTTMVMPALPRSAIRLRTPLTSSGIERARHLVEQDDLRFHRQRAGDGNALLLTAGEPAGTVMLAARKADIGEPRLGDALGLAFGRPLIFVSDSMTFSSAV